MSLESQRLTTDQIRVKILGALMMRAQLRIFAWRESGGGLMRGLRGVWSEKQGIRGVRAEYELKHHARVRGREMRVRVLVMRRR